MPIDTEVKYRRSKIAIKAIAITQLVGGISGLILISYLLLNTDLINGPTLFIFLCGIFLFVYSIYCSIKLLGVEKKKGILFSLINQILQIFQFNIFGYGLSYSSGCELTFSIKHFKLDADFAIVKSNFLMSINSGQIFFKINLIPLLAIALLIYAYKQIQIYQR